jgi:HK97 gp10 family phage protein
MAKYSATINYQGNLVAGGQVKTKAVQAALSKAAKYGQTLVKATTPRKTEALANSWKVTPKGNGLLWYNPMPYAGFVELGTKHMTGRRMMTRAVERTQEYFKNEVGRELGVRMASNAIANYSNIRLTSKGATARSRR